MTPAEIGAAIRALRKERGMTTIRMAEEMTNHGVKWDTSRVSRTESGETNLYLHQAIVLALVLDVTLDELVNFDPKRAEIAHLEARLAELRGDQSQEN